MSKFFGWLLIIVGVLIIGTAGLCAARMLTGPSDLIPEARRQLAALVGGVPFIFGVACVIAGWVMRKGKKQ